MCHDPKGYVSRLYRDMTQSLAADGLPPTLITLMNANGMMVTVMDIGATWLSALVPVEETHREVVLGVQNMAQFYEQKAYLGATVGRYANRLAQGRFSYQDRVYTVSQNQGEHCLHGGGLGFDRQRWRILSATDTEVCLGLISPDGDMGFPGEVTVEVRYQLEENNTLTIAYFGKTDQPTPLNLTNHAYFNLMGAESGLDVLSHFLAIQADVFLPTDQSGIPLGQWQSVTNTGFDFRVLKPLVQDFMQDEAQQNVQGYDHSFVFDADPCLSKALLMSPDKKLSLSISTTKPAMQVYTGNFLAGCPNRSGGEYQNHSGVALETQYLPDAPNHPEWGGELGLLLPNKLYCHHTKYHFMTSSAV